ncbi:hypothetical protein CDL12_16472 [Handroanthus impetiginosus]|uniref:Uncharacterized protein n=1 Tax=Handroanthus impetiginosus TaxID=429701 RepID=A0A2G9H078_9LAMI|nr:hypothetical protein CDL12_16472 [Handroanthus impetiginosus]
MYATRPLSQLLKSPESLTAQPDGPNSGYLVIQDEESETYSCFGLCKNRTLKELPFPQNKELTVQYETGSGENSSVSLNPVFLIPVLNQPLSSNRYYAIVPHGKRKGEAFTCSREEDKINCCFCRCIKDIKPKPLDPNNIYQQFHIIPYEGLCTTYGTFFATSITSDGFPPSFLRQKGWTIRTKTPHNFNLGTAQGLDSNLRARFPDSDLSHRTQHPFTITGKYKQFLPCNFLVYCYSMYYEVTLEQRWEQIYTCEKKNNQDHNSVVIDTLVENEEVFVGGAKALWTKENGFVWFKRYGGGGQQMSVGLRAEIVERMKWEHERGGWVGGEEREVKISKEFKGSGDWGVFRCYVLVERFNLSRMDGSLVLSYDFKHFDVMKSKWE